MNFKPKTPAELAASKLMPEGVYAFVIITAENQISKNNNEMIKLTIGVYDADGGVHTVFDYLLATNAPRIWNFCQAVGLESKYNLGTLQSEDCIGRSGRVRLYIKKDKPNPGGVAYPDQNKVAEYTVAQASEAVPQAVKKPATPAHAPSVTPDDEDVPF